MCQSLKLLSVVDLDPVDKINKQYIYIYYTEYHFLFANIYLYASRADIFESWSISVIRGGLNTGPIAPETTS